VRKGKKFSGEKRLFHSTGFGKNEGGVLQKCFVSNRYDAEWCK
jgi:hypothetical protein